MCVVSMIGDHFEDKWREPFRPYVQPEPYTKTTINWLNGVSQKEFDDLKKEVLEMKELLRKAKLYDEKNNEPDCFVDDKIDFLKKVAALVGVNLEDIFKPK